MTPAEKDAAVLAVLPASGIAHTPRLIGALAACECGEAITQDSVLRSLKRIGAIRHPGGRYSAPAAPQPARDPLPPFPCVSCRRRVADYAGSRASGVGRKCRGCVEAGR